VNDCTKLVRSFVNGPSDLLSCGRGKKMASPRKRVDHMKSPLKEIKCARDGKCSKIFGAMSFFQLAVSPTDTCFLGKEVSFVDYWMRNK